MSRLSLTDKAIIFSACAHRKQVRKASDIPYISHPFGVAMLLKEAGCEEEWVVAGLLHDTLEDTETTEETIEDQFGKNILELVKGCSEPDKNQIWENRKKHTIEWLKTAPISVCVVTCADKLHNLRTVTDDYEHLGEALWDRFSRGKDQQKWYYMSILEVLETRLPNHPLFLDYKETVLDLFTK